MKQTTFIAVTALVAGLGAGAAAQDPQEMARRAEIERMAATQTMARTAVEARFTTGAPYAAEAVTESTQQLADGNRIVKKSITRIFRDSEGRTRREQLAANGVDIQTVNISDPVAESTFVLFPETRTAFRNGVVIATPRGVATASVGPGATGVVTATRSPDGTAVSIQARETSAANEGASRATAEAGAIARSGGAGAGGGVAAGGGRGRGAGAGGMLPAKQPGPGDPGVREDLGQQTIEGVVATGTRVTTTIPAGAIGNEQPIKVVSEQWFSPDLQVLVLTKHSDPRTGDTVYRLTNIVRSEQVRSLFEVPPDYTLKDSIIRRDMR
ncbi:MAG TPA: hypothetical protein VHI99_03680 [Vicinamibacterales bacterium]|jgi:hypothetical protein|nr:hypothetical protein [Vicinamibacterales bacterium]